VSVLNISVSTFFSNYVFSNQHLTYASVVPSISIFGTFSAFQIIILISNNLAGIGSIEIVGNFLNNCLGPYLITSIFFPSLSVI